MGFFSKAWKGIKGVVKKVARTVKKVAKTVVTALPGGDKIWEFGTKIGKGIEKGIGWIGEKLGPIGTMALSFVLPFAAPLFAGMWAGFGAAAAGMAATGGTIASALGTVGSAIFNGANFVGGTLGAMGKAIAEGVSNLGKGQFGAAGNAFTSNMKSAFTGEAGKASVSKAIAGFPKVAGEIGKASSYTLENAGYSPRDNFGMKDLQGNTLFPDAADVYTPLSNTAPGAGTVLKSPIADASIEAAKPGFIEKSIDALSNLGGGSAGGEPVEVADNSGYDQGLQSHTISAAGQVDPIKAVSQGGNLYAQLIANASKGGLA